MKLKNDIAGEIARNLLQINAIKLNVKNPFIWASGLHSPIYCDNRRIWSFPEIRTLVVDKLVTVIKSHYPEVELIAGVATGAIAPGVLVAEKMQLPFVYVRSSPKSHGLGVQVEGYAPTGSKTVVVEDLISTAKSSLAAYHSLHEHGLVMLGMAAIFTYELDVAKKNLEQAGCPLVTLSNYHTLIELAQEQNIISREQLAQLREWRENPQAWSDTAGIKDTNSQNE
jgi:orotate phosphoribosyltransferase